MPPRRWPSSSSCKPSAIRLQFLRAFVTTLFSAYQGAETDLNKALDTNSEVYHFLKAACAKYGIGFLGPRFRNYPSGCAGEFEGVLWRTDYRKRSTYAQHGRSFDARDWCRWRRCRRCNGWITWEVLNPKLVGVKLTGELSGWAAPKDIILHVAEKLW